MISGVGPPRPCTFADALGEASGHVLAEGVGWRVMIMAGAEVADEATPPLPERRALDAVVRRVLDRDRALGLELEQAAMAYGGTVFDAAVLLGAALARTWPDRLEDLDAWPDRALALAHIATANTACVDGGQS